MPLQNGATPIAITAEEKPSKTNGWKHLYYLEYTLGGRQWVERPPMDFLRVWTDCRCDAAQPHYAHGRAMLRWAAKAKSKLGRLQGARIGPGHRKS